MKTKSVIQHLKFGFLGVVMGFVVARIGFANFDELHNMFIFADLRMLYAFAAAVMMIMLIFFVISKKIPKQNKIIQPGTIPGSMLFGFGWAVCGACPSIVFVQLGSGKLAAVFTLIGIYLGVVIHKKMHARFFRWDTGSCGV
ncbi:MAG: YeeE/YedE family protein [Gammaproteobacteria bacterium]|nr:YeeE/YedE family protein [Gammaproteobacteria bacterium]